MTWPIPAPGDITSRAAGALEVEFARVYALRNPGAPPATPDARSPNSLLAVHARSAELVTTDLYLYQTALAAELFVDTCSAAGLPRHGAKWGVPQGQPVAASGNAVFTVAAAIDVPAGFTLTAPGNAVYVATAAGTTTGAGSVSIPTAAQIAGSAGDLPALTALTPVNPLAGLVSVAVDANGLTGGEDLESTDSWRARIIQRIRQRGAGGNESDWEQWAREALPGALAKAISPGLGLVTVAIAMPLAAPAIGWRVPTTAELATATAYLNDARARRPLGVPVAAVVAATLVPLAFTLHLNPDTVATQAAAITALTEWALADATIGGTLFMSRADAALAAADGEFSHERTAPAADYAAAPTALATFGGITFT